MLPRWSRALTQLSRLGSQRSLNHGNEFYAISRQSYAKAAAAVAPVTTDTLEKGLPSGPMVRFRPVLDFNLNLCGLSNYLIYLLSGIVSEIKWLVVNLFSGIDFGV